MLCVLGKGEPCFPPSYSSSRWQHGWLPSVDQGQRSSSCHVWRNADPPYRRFSSLSPKRRKKRPDAGVHGGGWGCFGLKWLLISLAGVWFTAPAKVDSVLVRGGGGLWCCYFGFGCWHDWDNHRPSTGRGRGSAGDTCSLSKRKQRPPEHRWAFNEASLRTSLGRNHRRRSGRTSGCVRTWWYGNNRKPDAKTLSTFPEMNFEGRPPRSID